MAKTSGGSSKFLTGLGRLEIESPGLVRDRNGSRESGLIAESLDHRLMATPLVEIT